MIAIELKESPTRIFAMKSTAFPAIPIHVAAFSAVRPDTRFTRYFAYDMLLLPAIGIPSVSGMADYLRADLDHFLPLISSSSSAAYSSAALDYR
jgi:hypothetical protein